MSSRRSFNSLFVRFFLALLVVSMIPLGINVFQLWQIETHLKQNIEKELINKAKQLTSDVNHWTDLSLSSANLIAKTTQIRSMLPSFQIPALKALEETFDWTYTAFTTNLKGQEISRSETAPLTSHRRNEYMKAIMSGAESGQEVLINPSNQFPSLCLSVPITKKSSLIGALVQCSQLVDISENIVATKIGKTGYARLVDSKQRLIAHGNSALLSGALQDVSKDPLSQIQDFNIPAISTLEGKKIISYSTNSNLNWRLTVVQDYDEAYANLNEIKRQALIAGALLLLGLFLMAYLLGNSITKPIRKLAEAADTLSKGGDLDLDIPAKSRKDEIGELAQTVDRLGQGARVMMRRYQKLKEESNSK